VAAQEAGKTAVALSSVQSLAAEPSRALSDPGIGRIPLW